MLEDEYRVEPSWYEDRILLDGTVNRTFMTEEEYKRMREALVACSYAPRIPRRRDEIGTGVWGWCLGSAVVLLLVLIGLAAWRG